MYYPFSINFGSASSLQFWFRAGEVDGGYEMPNDADGNDLTAFITDTANPSYAVLWGDNISIGINTDEHGKSLNVLGKGNVSFYFDSDVNYYRVTATIAANLLPNVQYYLYIVPANSTAHAYGGAYGITYARNWNYLDGWSDWRC